MIEKQPLHIGQGLFFTFPLYKSHKICYNALDVSGKQVQLLYEPVAVKHTHPQGCNKGLTLLPQRRGQGHWETEKADLCSAESKYPELKNASVTVASADEG